jgi:hypothetical protein
MNKTNNKWESNISYADLVKNRVILGENVKPKEKFIDEPLEPLELIQSEYLEQLELIQSEVINELLPSEVINELLPSEVVEDEDELLPSEVLDEIEIKISEKYSLRRRQISSPKSLPIKRSLRSEFSYDDRNSNNGDSFKSFSKKGSFFTGPGTGPKEQFYAKAQNRRRLDSDNKKYNKNFYSAGILPFYVKNNTLYFLLGKDSDGKWSDFGGRSEGQDRGRWDITASREFYEETIGSVVDMPSMMAKLQNKKNHIKVKGKTLNGSAYFMYVVRIPYKESYRQYFQNTLSFIKYTKENSHQSNKSSFLEYKYFEKTDIQWVSLDTLKVSLEPEENLENVNYPLRNVFKRTLEGHIDRIVDFCSRFYGLNVFNEHINIESNSEGNYKTLQGFYGSTGSSEAADKWRN